MKWFGRPSYAPVNGTETEDQIEVDQISFTSSNSSGEHEGYTTPLENTSRLTDLISFEDNEFNLPGPSETSLISEPAQEEDESLSSQLPYLSCISFSEQPTTSSETDTREVFKESLLIRHSIFWFNDNEVDKSKLKLPVSTRGRVCRFDNEVDDNHLENMCRALQVTSGLTERSRWLNTISRDPVLAALAREIDEEFPTAMLDSSSNGNVQNPPSEGSESTNGIDIQKNHSSSVSTTTSSIPGSFQTAARIPSSPDLSPSRPSSDSRIIRTVVPARKGIDAIEIRRRINETVGSICCEVIRKAIAVDEPRDRRVAKWMKEYANDDSWINEITAASRKHDQYSFEVPPLAEDWVVHVHKQPPIRAGLETQQWKCASCRQSLHAINLNDKDVCPRFCEYFGLYFCTLCHGGEKTIIPSRIISLWNFNEVPVCDRAFRFLRAVRELPVFRIRELSVELIKKNKSLRTVIELRTKLKHMEQFIKMCAFASEQVTDFGNLGTMFASLDRYLLEADDLFSLNDLLRVHNRDLLNLLEPLAKHARTHILKCKRCEDQAHVCVKCCDLNDRLFPFEERVSRCDDCGSLSHSPRCPRRDVPRDSSCPKCLRISKTRSRQRILAVGTIGDV